MKIFFSYPHDPNAPFVERIKAGLEARGHDVWFDQSEIKSGDDWRSKITRGILDSETVVAFLSKHSVRDPGVCLNEIAIALAEKGDEAIVTVLVEPEREVSAPVSITHIQWLKMEEHLSNGADEGWYRTHFDELVEVIEHPASATRNAELEQLKQVLHPLSFNADIAYHLPRFTGRQWLVARYEDWLTNQSRSKVFRIEGGPGMGKTAVASFLAHATKSSVLGVHLCKSGSKATQDPAQLVLSLAYQMATRLPDYRARLLRVPSIKNPALMQGEDAGSLWDLLISEPLWGAGKAGLIDRQRLAIVIDGLDEATENRENKIVDLLVDHIQTLPAWVGVVLTGRPDPELAQSLKHYRPQIINADDPANLEDLRRYIDAWLKDELKAGRLLAHQAPTAAQMLMQKSEGAFLYLAMAREEAQQSFEDGSKSFDLNNPATLPSGLNALYLTSFKRRFPEALADPDNPASRWNALVKPLLGYMLASPEPLPLDLARELLGWDKDRAGDENQHKTLQALGSLIKRNGDVVKPEACTLAPFHNSVREWLQDADADAAGDFYVSAKDPQLPLAQAVWERYLQSKEKDAYGWAVLPVLLPELNKSELEQILGPPNWDTSQVLYRLADSLAPKLRFEEAAATWAVQVRFAERLAATEPESAEFAYHLSMSYSSLGAVQKALGNIQAAFDLYQQCGVIVEQLASGAPANLLFARELGVSDRQLGRMEEILGNRKAALARYQTSLLIAEFLVDQRPADLWLASDLSTSYECVGDMQRALGNHQAAQALYEQSQVIRERLVAQAPENAGFARNLGLFYMHLGVLQQALRNCQAALALFQKCLVIFQRLAASAPENAQYADALSITYGKLGEIDEEMGNNQGALGFYHDGLMIHLSLAASAPENAEYANNLSISYGKLGGMQEALGYSQEALETYHHCVVILQRLVAKAPENVQVAQNLCLSYDRLGDMQAAMCDSQAALELYQQGLVIRERLAASAPEDPELSRKLFHSYWRCATVTKGENQTQWWRKVHSTMTSMQQRGVLAKEDAKYFAAVEYALGLD